MYPALQLLLILISAGSIAKFAPQAKAAAAEKRGGIVHFEVCYVFC